MSCFQTLKEMGYRLSLQRQVILETLHETDGHITAEDIYHRVRARCPGANKSTVYRTLELLKRLNLVAETNLGGNSLYYHHMEKADHHHLICQRCGRVFDANEEILGPLKEFLIRKYNFVPEIRHLAIFGHCVHCRGENNVNP